MAAMDQNMLPELLEKTIEPQKLFPYVGARFVEIILDEPLRLILSGAKRAVLGSCQCHLPALNQKAISLNHAYTLASQVMEPKRKSHTGNAFQRLHCLQGSTWTPLEILRQTAETAFRARRAATQALVRGPNNRVSLSLMDNARRVFGNDLRFDLCDIRLAHEPEHVYLEVSHSTGPAIRTERVDLGFISANYDQPMFLAAARIRNNARIIAALDAETLLMTGLAGYFLSEAGIQRLEQRKDQDPPLRQRRLI